MPRAPTPSPSLNVRRVLGQLREAASEEGTIANEEMIIPGTSDRILRPKREKRQKRQKRRTRVPRAPTPSPSLNVRRVLGQLREEGTIADAEMIPVSSDRLLRPKREKRQKRQKRRSARVPRAPTPSPSLNVRRALLDLSHSDDDANSRVNQLWLGREMSNTERSKTVSASLVVTYCNGDLNWIRKYTDGFNFDRTFVAVKCGIFPDRDILPEGAELVPLPNVGGCDHTMAYWMSEVLPTLPGVRRDDDNAADENSGNEVVLFLKDDLRIRDDGMNVRDFRTLLDLASSDQGFGCVLEPSPDYGFSYYHDIHVLQGFEMSGYTRASSRGADDRRNERFHNSRERDAPFKSPFETLGGWHKALEIALPRPLVPVCYGGMYMVKRSKIKEVPLEILRNMTISLSRGNNIEEGHFAERTWAGLFSDSLNIKDTERLLGLSRMIYPFHDSWTGALMRYAVKLHEANEIL